MPRHTPIGPRAGHSVIRLAALGDLVEDVVAELDGPVNIASDTPARITRRRGGSAANTAITAARLCGTSRFLGQVGDDAIGTALLDTMTADGVDVTHVRRSGDTGTIVALVDHHGERSMLTDRRACVDLDRPDPGWLDDVDVLHVPLYSLAVEPVATTAATVIGWAHDRGIPVSVDVSSTSVMAELGIARVRSLLEELQPSVLLANADEAALLAIDGPLAGSITVVKRGPDPAVVYQPGRRPVEVPAVAVDEVPDTTGAGDAFAAGFLTDAGWQDDPESAVSSGHRAAARLLSSRTARR